MKSLAKLCLSKAKYGWPLAMVVLLPACTTVQIPNIDFKRLPEFIEETRDISDYPKVSDVPPAPEEIRSAEEWDEAVKSLLNLRDANTADIDRTGITNSADSSLDIESLKAKVRAYKLDDPQ